MHIPRTRTFSLIFSAATLALCALAAEPALAEGTQISTSTNPEAQAHCDKANALYMSGAYREAIAELELAVAIDPNGKDLIANLATVHEKLGDIDDAIAYSQRYEQMDLAPEERARVERTLTRLQGAKAEVLAKQAAELEKLRRASASYGLLPAPPAAQRNGRLDGLVISGAAIATVGLGVGTGFGISALSEDRSKSGATAADAMAVAEQHRAHTAAIVSDAGFGVFIAAATTTAVLYFARAAKVEPPVWSDRATASLTPTSHGGLLKLNVSF